MSLSTSPGGQARDPASADPDSGPTIDFDPTLRLGDLFASAATRHPEEVALRFEGHELDYRTLAAQVSRVSRGLARHGIGPGHRVGVCAQRSHGMFQSLLGVLVSGAAFVPLDPAMPAERMREVCEDADLSAVIGPAADLALAGTTLPRETPHLAVEELVGTEVAGEETLHVAGSSDDPAYVIFTSGSTGRPKGAVNAHRGVVNRLLWGQLDWPIGPGDRVVQKTPFTFDVSVWEYLWPLTTGAMLVVARPGGHRDPAYIASLVRSEGITLAHFVPSMLRLFLHEPTAAQCRSLRRVMCSGEALTADSVRRFHDCLPGVRLSNLYGPTEAAIEVTRWECDPARERNPVPIGAPVANTRIYVLDPEGKKVAPGQEGEIVIAGVQVGLGYFGRPELTEAVFKDDPFHPGERMYHTGDLGRWAPDGVVECLGRIDHQVKIRGNRIELGEIEARLRRHPGLRDCVASALPDPLGETRLVVHLVPAGRTAPSLHDIHEFLRDQLPDYMLPDAVVAMDALPLLSSGKTDRRALPAPAFSTPQKQSGGSSTQSSDTTSIGDLWRELLGQPDLPDSANLFDAGARSVTVLAFLSRMRESGAATITVGDIYDRPTIAALEKLHRGRDTGPVQARKATGGAVAIVGMAVRAPGANDLASFWSMLCEGREGIRRFAPDELDPEVPQPLRSRGDFVPAKGIIEDADRFDAALFGVPPREATLTDPQQRILVEMALHALEHAGIDPERCPDIGVFVGTANNTYVAHLRQHAAQLVAQSGEFATMVGNDKDFVATRIAHRLNLKGPAISVHTACSTGLVTVTQAVQALRSGQCEAALAGGATVIVPQRTGHLHIEGGMESADGHCRPFDAGASGTVFSSGAALVVLRRLEDALAAGDTVYAVIEGIGVNNDGGHKASFTAPSVEGQCDAIRRALRDADADPADIGFVEAHGTGTPLGDPIEVSGLARAWGSRDPSAEHCVLGSVKANVGHTIAAAGVLGLIRCALSLHHETIPGTPHFDAPNPHIDFSTTPFTVQREARPWPRRPRRRLAAVSSFGVGGTNAHVVLGEGPPVQEPASQSHPLPTPLWLPVSGADRDAVLRNAEALAMHLENHSTLALRDVAATLGRRTARSFRTVATGRDCAEAVAALRSVRDVRAALDAPRVVFLFPGQGSQHPGMAAGLRESLPAFATAFDAVMDVIRPHVDIDLAGLLLDREAGEDAAALLAQTRYAQPALFAMSYALATWLRSLGIEPAAMIGHSIGEYAAAAVSGMIDMESAAGCVCARGAAMQAQPPGAMLAVRAALADVEPLLGDTAEVAASNAPALTVLSGPSEGIEAIAARLGERDFQTTRLKVSHAFHSRSMEGALSAVECAWRAVHTREPQIPFYSCVTGAPITREQGGDPAYWARQVRQPVRFSDALMAEIDQPDTVFVEVGPSQALSSLVRAHRRGDGSVAPCVALLPPASGGDPAAPHAVQAVGRLWALGLPLAPVTDAQVRRVELPGYCFADTRFWYPRPESIQTSEALPAASTTVATTPAERPQASAAAVGGPPADRRSMIESELRQVLAGVAGLSPAEIDGQASLLEQGLDSLSLTQAALEISRVFDCRVALRELLGPLDRLGALVDHLDARVAPDRFRPATVDAAPETVAQTPQPADVQEAASSEAVPAAPVPTLPAVATSADVTRLIEQQMALMAQQLELLRSIQGSMAIPAQARLATPTSASSPSASDAGARTAPSADEASSTTPEAPVSGPLGPGQMERWLAANFDDRGMLALNETLRLELAGELDVMAFQDAAREVFDRHGAFRLAFDEEQPHQHLNDTARLQLERVDLDRRPDLLGALESLCDEYANTRFDMGQPPLARALLIRVRPGHHVFLLVVSHLIFDGWSSSVLVRELAQAYRARTQGIDSGLPEADSPVAFAMAERDRFEGSTGQADLAWWCDTLRDVPEAPRLGDVVPTRDRGFSCSTLRHEFNAPALQALRRRATPGKATLFHLLLACLASEVADRTGRPRVVVGVPYPGQAVAGRHHLIGDGALDLPVLLDLSQSEGFDATLRIARDAMVEALEHPNITQGTLARALGLKANGDRPPITGVFFNLNPRVPLSGFDPLVASVREATKPGLLSEAFFNFYELNDTLLLELHYSRDFFSEGHAQKVLDGLVERIAKLGVDDRATEGPGKTATVEHAAAPPCSGPTLAYPRTIRVDEYVCPTLRRTEAALVFHDTCWRGEELDDAANRLARALRGRGIGRGRHVGLCLERGPSMLVSVLAVLKSGAAYVPLDPAYPDARLQVIAEDADFDLVLAEAEAVLGWLGDVQRLDPTEAMAQDADASPLPPDPEHDAAGEDPAYVIFTSGSTGRPKGVVVPHRAVVNFLSSMAMEPGLGAQDRLVAVTTLCFDISVLELMLPLATGATLVLAGRDQAADSEALIQLLEDSQATVMQATPSTWRMLLETGWKGREGFKALVGGEALPPGLARELMALGLELWNMYGPTETTVWSSLWPVRDADAIRVGRPIANTTIHVLDADLNPCPAGSVGEIFIGGDGLALGYLGRDDLTRERFLPAPEHTGSAGPIYRTGDLGRWDASGQLEHLGRADFQLKVRGHRIEPGEIEHCIARHPDVGQTVVVAREVAPGDVRLVAYVTARSAHSPDPASVREHIVEALPHYLVPQHVIVLPGLPLTPNGKIDRNALPCPLTVIAHAKASAGAEDARVEMLLELVREVLGDPGVQADDNFFESGGHSLLALSVAARVKARTGVRPNLLRLANSSLRTVAMELPGPGHATQSGGRQGLGRRLLRLIGGERTEQHR